jgi:hypothetical protein
MVYTPHIYIGLVRTIYIRCIYGILGREITKYTVIYSVYIRFWPTLHICVWLWPAQLLIVVHRHRHRDPA